MVQANPPPDRNRLPWSAAELRLSLGGDDAFVVKVAWAGPEDAGITWETVSRVSQSTVAPLPSL